MWTTTNGDFPFSFASVVLLLFLVRPDTLYNNRRLIIYNTILAIFMLFPLVFVSGELDMLAESPLLMDSYFWFVMVFTGIIGFLINISTFLQIKHTSPLTHNLSGTAKVTYSLNLSLSHRTSYRLVCKQCCLFSSGRTVCLLWFASPIPVFPLTNPIRMRWVSHWSLPGRFGIHISGIKKCKRTYEGNNNSKTMAQGLNKCLPTLSLFEGRTRH